MNDDLTLLRQYAASNSEAAFAALVNRHVNLVYSVALRQAGDPHLAEEITQAVFIILARKADKISPSTVLAGWLCRTARYAAADALKNRQRRQQREQEVYMQSILTGGGDAPSPQNQEETWTHIAPLLDGAMEKLGQKDHDALVLRFFEGKNFSEVGAALGASEDAAKVRVHRALEKLYRFFNQRGVSSTMAILAGTISTNATQVAPVGLAKTISVVAVARGAAAGTSTLTLVKGALKIMAWTKMKTAVVVGVSVLLAAGTTTVVVEKVSVQMNSILQQHLDDGSILLLNRISYGDKHDFGYGSKTKKYSWPGHNELMLEFKLISKNPESNPLVKPAFYRQFRCVLRGEGGIEYMEEFTPGNFKKDSDGYYGDIGTSIIPRNSRWLWLRIEKRNEQKRYDVWQTEAEFKFANPASPANFKWTANSTPATNAVDGMKLVLGEVTVKTVPNYTNDIWNHIVAVPTEVWDNGVLLTNWAPAYTQVKDASGNWNSNLQKHRSLDPHYVWKLDMDFEMVSDFPPENIFTVPVPMRDNIPTSTNILDMPVSVSWDGYYVDVNIPTNRTDIALKYIRVTDAQGNKSSPGFGGGSWSKFGFRAGSFYQEKRGVLTQMDKPATITFAIVPNVHTTFYVQPRLVTE